MILGSLDSALSSKLVREYLYEHWHLPLDIGADLRLVPVCTGAWRAVSLLRQTGDGENFPIQKRELKDIRAPLMAFSLLLRGPRHSLSVDITQMTVKKLTSCLLHQLLQLLCFMDFLLRFGLLSFFSRC